MAKRPEKNLKKIFAVAVVLLLLTAAVCLYFFYNVVLKPNLNIDADTYVHIPTGSTFVDVSSLFDSMDLIRNKRSFTWLARKKNYPARVLPGRYLLNKNMGNNSLINVLRSGRQEPVNLTFNNIRTPQQLSGVIAQYLEADSASIISLMNDADFLRQYSMNPQTAVLLFIPNTYEFFWNTSAQQLFDRMHREYQRFWNESRMEKADRINLSPRDAMILASIVRSETSKQEEMPRIAGVYINRLKRNMPLQADPTVIFATGDFTIKRVLHRHLAIDSPYNTYRYTGLPPGPIALPEPFVIESVLNFENHNYLYFCATEDFSGYHAFARTYTEHLANARRYQQALSRSQNNR